MRSLAQIGTVFAIPIDFETWGVGQVLAHRYPSCLMAAFETSYSSLPSVDELSRANVLYVGDFYDTLIRNGRWKTIGVTAVDSNSVVFPKHKVFIDGRDYVESWDCKHRRLASVEEVSILHDQIVSGPILLENALRHFFGRGSDDVRFDSFKIESVMRRDAIEI